MQALMGKKGRQWALDPEDNRRGIWFSCSYGQWTVLLVRKVQGTVVTCWSGAVDLSVKYKNFI